MNETQGLIEELLSVLGKYNMTVNAIHIRRLGPIEKTGAITTTPKLEVVVVGDGEFNNPNKNHNRL